MATQVTVIGNLTADPDLRKTQSGDAVANFTVAHTERVRDEDGDFVDGDTSFFRVSVWKALGKNAAASLKKGHQVIVTGRLKIRDYEDKDGNQRRSAEITADAVGASLQFGSTKFAKGTAKVSSGETADADENTEEGADEPKQTTTKRKSSASTRSKASAGSSTASGADVNDLFK